MKDTTVKKEENLMSGRSDGYYILTGEEISRKRK